MEIIDSDCEEEVPKIPTPQETPAKKRGRPKKIMVKKESLELTEKLSKIPAKKRARPVKVKVKIETLKKESLNLAEKLSKIPAKKRKLPQKIQMKNESLKLDEELSDIPAGKRARLVKLKNEDCVCDHCGKEMGSVKSLKDHNRRFHTRFSCPMCSKKYGQASHLARHKAACHN